VVQALAVGLEVSAKMLGPASGWTSSNCISPCQASAWRSENSTSSPW
jgi:hypothetical protein